MSEQEEPTAPVAHMHTLAHVQSLQYTNLNPQGYVFALAPPMVRLIYYHDEFRPFLEVISPDGSSTFQSQPVRVQDVGITVGMEDFVRLVAQNLLTIATFDRTLLEKYKITIGEPGHG